MGEIKEMKDRFGRRRGEVANGWARNEMEFLFFFNSYERRIILRE